MEDAVLELIELVLVGVDGGAPVEPGQCQTSFLTVDDLDDGGDFDDGRSGANFQLCNTNHVKYKKYNREIRIWKQSPIVHTHTQT